MTSKSAIFQRAAEQWQDMKYDWERYVAVAYDCALEACSGVLINDLGREHGVDGYSLFTGNAQRAHRYASWELERYWEQHPRLTMSEFEQQWLDGNYEQLAA